MEPALERKIDELTKLTEENNKMLHKLRSGQKTANAMRAIYWLVIIGISLGAFYYVQPYLNQLTKLYTNGAASLDQLQGGFSDLKNIQELFGTKKTEGE